MGPWATLYLVMTFVACALGLLAGRRQPVFAVSVLIFTIWLLGRAAHVMWEEPWALATYPLMDTVGGLVCYELWRERGKWWLRALSGLFWTQLALAAFFWSLRAFVLEPEQFAAALYNYKSFNNVIYALSLLLISWEGGRRVVDNILAWIDSRGLGLRLRDALHIRGAGHPPAPTRR
jgi:hypothetical protein